MLHLYLFSYYQNIDYHSYIVYNVVDRVTELKVMIKHIKNTRENEKKKNTRQS